MKITLEWLEEQGACEEGVAWFKAQKETESVAVLKALIADEEQGYANWLIVRVMADYKQGREMYLKYAIFAAEQVIDIYEKTHPKDDRPRKAIEAAKAVLVNDTPETRAAAWAAAWAAEAAGAAAGAAWAAAGAAEAAGAVWAAAWAAGAARAAGAAWAARAAGAVWAAWAAGAARAAEAAGAAWYVGRPMQLKILEYGIGLLESESDKKGD